MKYSALSRLPLIASVLLAGAVLPTTVAPQPESFDTHLKTISAPNNPPELRFFSSRSFLPAGSDVPLNLQDMAGMGWPAISNGEASTLGDWLTHLAGLKSEKRSKAMDSMLSAFEPAHRAATKQFLLALLDDGHVYDSRWQPSETDTSGDGVVIGAPCTLSVGNASYRGLQAAAIVWDTPAAIKKTERKVGDLVATKRKYVGSTVQNAFVVPGSELTIDAGETQREAWKFFVHDDPSGFGNFKFSFVLLDEHYSDGHIHTAYRATGEDYGADRFDELAGEDEYLPLYRSDGSVVGTLMVSSLILEYSLEYWLGDGYDSDGDRGKALNGGVGNTKRLNQVLRK